MATLIGIFTIPQLFAGYCLYAVFTVMFVYALRHGELSVLYPLIALGYVWVTITAVLAFHETMNPLKIVGLAVIMCGVAVLGWGGRRRDNDHSGFFDGPDSGRIGDWLGRLDLSEVGRACGEPALDQHRLQLAAGGGHCAPICCRRCCS